MTIDLILDIICMVTTLCCTCLLIRPNAKEELELLKLMALIGPHDRYIVWHIQLAKAYGITSSSHPRFRMWIC